MSSTPGHARPTPPRRGGRAGRGRGRRTQGRESGSASGAGGRGPGGPAPPGVLPVRLPVEFGRPRAPPGAGGEKDGREKLILCVGTVEPRKNQTGLVRAFQALAAERPGSGWRLVLVGNLHPAVKDEIE